MISDIPWTIGVLLFIGMACIAGAVLMIWFREK
jgi:hypothetical protein